MQDNQEKCKELAIRIYNPVSYTHLDVYKRQDQDRAGLHAFRAG